MVEITLVRHGQANTGAEDEKGYDLLTPLGFDQARWLGEHLAANGRRFDHVICGAMRRHRETAGEIVQALDLELTQDARLNEMDYFGLARSLQDTHALPLPRDRQDFLSHVHQVFGAWEQGDIHSHLETFAAFEARIAAMISLAEDRGGRVLFVTSGGVIGMVMRLLLDLDTRTFANVLLQIHNSSLHRYVKATDTLVLDAFNAIPHLEQPDRAHARTYI